MEKRISNKCQNCPKLKKIEMSIDESNSALDYSEEIRAKYEKLEVELMAEAFGTATTELLKEAVATGDMEYIKLAEIYTKPVIEILNRYLAGQHVSAKDFVEAAALGTLDAKERGLVQESDIQEMMDALSQFYNFNDANVALQEKITTASNIIIENNEYEEERLKKMQENCPGPKKSIFRLGGYACQSPKK